MIVVDENSISIMDVRDIDTKCIPETMALGIERIAYILKRWLGFWFRHMGVSEADFARRTLEIIQDVQNIAHWFRYVIRIFIEDYLIEFERKLAGLIETAVQNAK